MDVSFLNDSNKAIRLLWTGGWDSTFRLIELSRKNVCVQPIYLYGDGRKSMENEIHAMDTILDMLWKHPRTQAQILPILKVEISTIPENEEITQAYHNIIQEYKLGTQYEWIARYAAINPGVELCVEKPHEHGIGYFSKIINREGKIIPTGDVHEYKVESKSGDVQKLLGNVFFPIKNKTEHDMRKLIAEWQYEDIMKEIWFCHSPVNGKPCGICRPCCEKVESEMGFLLGKKARSRNRIYKFLGGGFLSNVYRRAVQKLNG